MSKPGALVGAALLVILSGCQAPPQRNEGSQPLDAPPSARYVQVVAHPDDDLLFMNPDLAEGVRAGRPTTGIYLTAGESDTPDPAHYSAERQEGTRASYAQMAHAPNEWRRSTIPAGQGHVAELNTLRANPDIKLVFLNLPDDANPRHGEHVLTRLSQDRHDELTVNTTLPAGSTVQHPQPYDRSAVVDALTTLFDTFRPTVVRLQDDQPDQRYQRDWAGVHNHPDHVHGADLAQEALGAYRPDGLPPTVVAYRDYNVADVPGGMSAQDQRTTREAFAAYSAHDALTSTGGVYGRWSDRSAYRWPRRDAWAVRDARGGVQAFSVQAHALAHWTRTAEGRWRGPDLQPLPEPLRPQVSLLGEGRGRPALVAQSADGARLLIKRQDRLGAWPREWQVLNTPAGADPAQTGPPAGAVDADGRMVLALKNSAGGVSISRESAPGSLRWQPWTDLGGNDVQDGASVVADREGAVHVFATDRAHALHWTVPESGPARSEQVPIGGAAPTGAPTATLDRTGRIRLLVRTDRDGELVERALTPAGKWDGRQTLPSPGGIGVPGLVAPGPHTRTDLVRIARDGAGAVHVAEQAGPRGNWSDLGGVVTDHPAAVAEPDGTMNLIGLGGDGRLMVNTGSQGAADLTFTGWQAAVTEPPDSVEQAG